MPSGPTGTRTHAGEAALGTDAVPRTPPVEEWPFRTEKGPSDSPEGRPPKRNAPKRNAPKRNAPKRNAPRRAGPRDEQVIGRRGPIRRASGPTCRTHRTAQGYFQSKHVRRRGAAHAEGTRRSVSVEGTLPPREAPLRSGSAPSFSLTSIFSPDPCRQHAALRRPTDLGNATTASGTRPISTTTCSPWSRWRWWDFSSRSSPVVL